MRCCLSRPWWVTFALCILLDGVSFFALRRPAVQLNPGVYLWGLAMSAIFFWWLGLVYRSSPRWLQSILAVALSCFLLLMVAVNIYIYSEFGQYLTGSMLGFITADPHYIHDYLKTYLVKSNAVVAIFLFAALLYLWYPRREPRQAGPPGSRSVRKTSSVAWGVVLPVVYAVSLTALRPYTTDMLTPVDTATLCAIAPSYRQAPKSELHYAADRLAVTPRSTDANAPNILILLNESWGKQQGFPIYGQPVDAMPFLNHWIQTERDHFIVWKTGYTSSTATDVSLPSLVTGVRPDESARKLHLMPLLWQWGKASGAYTFYLTSVRQTFGRLDQFFTCGDRDTTLSAENLNTPIVHEAGVDDVIAAGHLRDILARQGVRARFVGMIFTNALHSPFQAQSQMIAHMPPFESRYDKALYIVDDAIKVTADVLRERGLLDNTVIFFSGDHGESPAPSHTAHRIFSYYEEFFNIPYMIYVPERWKATHPDLYATLKANEIQNVSNLDILPTIVDLLGLANTNPALVAQFKGQSMVRPIDPDRVLVGLSTNDVRTWEQEGLGLAWGPYRFVCNNVDGPRFFDLTMDPLEQHNLWRAMDAYRKGVVMRTIRSSYHLNRVYNLTQPH
jgi:glucan phosphoethanolaminetransferase (alkaline phosphatase superfamily)